MNHLAHLMFYVSYIIMSIYKNHLKKQVIMINHKINKYIMNQKKLVLIQTHLNKKENFLLSEFYS